MSEPIQLHDYEATRDWRRMGRAIRYLTERYTEQPRLEDAADAVGLSPFHFQRLFTRYVGVSPKSFIGHLTLEHAKRELANGASVMDAAIESGLSGSSRLHDLSLKIEAMTPGEYAKGARGLSIEYGFADCPFGRVLVMATAKGVCGLAFGDEGEDERMLADIWQDLLGIGDIASDANFFDIGGHSLLAMTMIARVEKKSGVRLNLLKVANGSLRTLAMDLPRRRLPRVSISPAEPCPG